MADRKEVYDFKNVLETLIKSQGDLVEIITKWAEMLDTTPRYVEFVLNASEGAGNSKITLKVPNIQMIADTINERSLPPNAKFNTVTAAGDTIQATLDGKNLVFSDTRGNKYATISFEAGMESLMWVIQADMQSYTSWPVPRYWYLDRSGETTVTLMPNVPISATDRACDFFVWVDAGSTLVLKLHRFGSPQVLRLDNSAGNDMAVWHVSVMVARRPQSGGMYCTGGATLMA